MDDEQLGCDGATSSDREGRICRAEGLAAPASPTAETPQTGPDLLVGLTFPAKVAVALIVAVGVVLLGAYTELVGVTGPGGAPGYGKDVPIGSGLPAPPSSSKWGFALATPIPADLDAIRPAGVAVERMVGEQDAMASGASGEFETGDDADDALQCVGLSDVY